MIFFSKNSNKSFVIFRSQAIIHNLSKGTFNINTISNEVRKQIERKDNLGEMVRMKRSGYLEKLVACGFIELNRGGLVPFFGIANLGYNGNNRIKIRSLMTKFKNRYKKRKDYNQNN